MIVQAKLTTLEIEMQEDGQSIQIDRLPQYLFLGLEGHNSSKKLKKKGAIIKFLPESKDINSLVNTYLKKEKEYDGIVTSYTKAYNFVKRNRNLVITYLGLGKEPQCFIINKNEIQLTNDINEEIMKMRDNGLISKLCKYFFIAAAASRPSLIAQTTSEAPLTMSPAANTPFKFVSIVSKSVLIVPHFVT